MSTLTPRTKHAASTVILIFLGTSALFSGSSMVFADSSSFEFTSTNETCKDFIPSNETCVINTDSFTSIDTKVASVVKFDNVNRIHLLKWKWFDPAGKSYDNSSSFEIGNNGPGHYFGWWFISIAGYEPSYNPGLWSVEIYVDSQKLATQLFQVTYVRPPFERVSATYKFRHSTATHESITGLKTYNYWWVTHDDLNVTETLSGNVMWPPGTGSDYVIHYYAAWEYVCLKNQEIDGIVGSCYFAKPLKEDRGGTSSFVFTYTYLVHAGFCDAQPKPSDVVWLDANAYGDISSSITVKASCEGRIFTGPFGGFVNPSVPLATPVNLACVRFDSTPTYQNAPTYQNDTLVSVLGKISEVMVFGNVTGGTFDYASEGVQIHTEWSSQCSYNFLKDSGILFRSDHKYYENNKLVETYDENLTNLSLQLSSSTVAATSTLESSTAQLKSRTNSNSTVLVPSSGKNGLLLCFVLFGLVAIAIIVLAVRGKPLRIKSKTV